MPKTVVELQQFRETSSIPIKSDQGAVGMATLVNLNPTINAWYLLTSLGRAAPNSPIIWRTPNHVLED